MEENAETANRWAPAQNDAGDTASAPYYGEQNEDGIDLSLLRENLKLTPTERLVRHQRALGFIREVRRAGVAAGLRRPD